MASLTATKKPAPTKADIRDGRRLLEKFNKNPKEFIWAHSFLGHADSSHVDIKNEKLLDNILFRGKKNGDTVFENRAIQQKCMEAIIHAHIHGIAQFTNIAKPGDTVTYYGQLENEDGDAIQIGHGFIGQKDPSGIGADISKPIRAITSNTAAVIITKDPRAEDGWKITTAFPLSRIEPGLSEVEKEFMQITTIPDFDFAPVLHATESYQHASPIQRALLDYNNIDRKTMAAVPVQYVPRRNGREEQIIVPMPQGRYAGESVIVTGDERAAASRTGSFPLPTVIERITEHLMKKVNDQITQVETDRRARKLAAARDMQDMKIINAMNPDDTETGPGTGNDEPEIT